MAGSEEEVKQRMESAIAEVKMHGLLVDRVYSTQGGVMCVVKSINNMPVSHIVAEVQKVFRRTDVAYEVKSAMHVSVSKATVGIADDVLPCLELEFFFRNNSGDEDAPKKTPGARTILFRISAICIHLSVLCVMAYLFTVGKMNGVDALTNAVDRVSTSTKFFGIVVYLILMVRAPISLLMFTVCSLSYHSFAAVCHCRLVPGGYEFPGGQEPPTAGMLVFLYATPVAAGNLIHSLFANKL